MSDKITLEINHKMVEVANGVTVLEAARSAGIFIPTLCYHPDLQPYGGCRLCIVEIEGMRGLPASCTTPATNGMKVVTESARLTELRRTYLEFILTEHPNACLNCDRRERCQPNDVCLKDIAVSERCVTCYANGHCQLQAIVDYIGLESIALPYSYKSLPVDYEREPLIKRDYNLCILCGRCVQMCADVRGIGAIAITRRGVDTVVGTAFDRPLQDAGCRFCGACVEVCPTGALTDAAAERGKDADIAVKVPCTYNCPAHINVPLYVYLAGEGKYQESLAIVREKVPFPGTLGRVCIHPCETACRREALSDPISIRFLKRFVADHDDGSWKKYAKQLPPTGKKVAIVGSGPAGLTAGYYLAKAGHTVTVFEQFEKAGGMMRLGIPDYRLPPNVLDAEIAEIITAGVEIRLNTRIDNVENLFTEGYDAVFLAPGAHKGMRLGVEGDNLPGVYDGASFLRQVNLGHTVKVGNDVAVIGGGNVAIDSARVALREGAKNVHILYRRTREEMPASAEEIEAAIEEGIIIDYLTGHLKIRQENGRLVLTCNRMRLGKPDASGRKRPEPVEGSEFDRVYDVIIGAIGQRPEIPEGFGVATGHGDIIKADAATLFTGKKGIWAGGDAVSGPDSVIRAIAAGRTAAVSIDRYLGGNGDIDEELTTQRNICAYAGITPEGFKNARREKMPCLPPALVVHNFQEVETGFSEEAANREARRCFQCGYRLQINAAPVPEGEIEH